MTPISCSFDSQAGSVIEIKAFTLQQRKAAFLRGSHRDLTPSSMVENLALNKCQPRSDADGRAVQFEMANTA